MFWVYSARHAPRLAAKMSEVSINTIRSTVNWTEDQNKSNLKVREYYINLIEKFKLTSFIRGIDFTNQTKIFG